MGFFSKSEIPDKGNGGEWAKRNDRRVNYGTKADEYLDDKYEPSKVERRAATDKPPA